MAFADPRPQQGDTDNILLRKICQVLAGGSSSSSSGLLTQAVGPDAISTASTSNPVQVGATVYAPTGLPADFTTGLVERIIADLKGILYVHQADLQRRAQHGDASGGDAVTNYRPQYGTVSNFTPTTPSTGTTVFTLAAGEVGYIQNTSGTNPLFVKLGASATTSSYNQVLKAGSGAADGNGGVIVIDNYIGAVSVAGTTPTLIAYKVS